MATKTPRTTHSKKMNLYRRSCSAVTLLLGSLSNDDDDDAEDDAY